MKRVSNLEENELNDQFSGDDSDYSDDNEEEILENIKVYRFDEDVDMNSNLPWCFPIIQTMNGSVKVIFDKSFIVCDGENILNFGRNLDNVRKFYIEKLNESIKQNPITIRILPKTIKKLNTITYPCYKQQYKDGINVVATHKGFYHNNRIYSCPFFNEIETFLNYLPFSSSLDCTIYCDELGKTDVVKTFKKRFIGEKSEHNFKCCINDLILIGDEFKLLERMNILNNAYSLFKKLSSENNSLNINEIELVPNMENVGDKTVLIKYNDIYSFDNKNIYLYKC